MKENAYICTKCLTVQTKAEMMQRKKRVGKLSNEQSKLWEECKVKSMLEQDLERCYARLEIQKSTLNQIQDYFEHQSDGCNEDKQHVLGLLDMMVDQFMLLYDKEYEELENERVRTTDSQ